jgi:hypothetical protein
MKVTVIPSDRMIYLDGVAKICRFKCDKDIHAIQFNGDSGYIEYKNHNKVEEFSGFDKVKYFVDIYNNVIRELI